LRRFSEDGDESDMETKKIEKLVNLTFLEDKIKTLPNGLSSKVGDNAIKLSGGEKQRIAIARALYKDFNLLFLDEFTSSLDVKTEEKIIKNIMTKFSDKTLIVVSHKVSTLKMCDKIINLDEDYDN